MNFDEAVEYLLGLGHETLTIKLGLSNTELLLDALGNPHRKYQSVQIAGTNGKGSTAVFLDSICRKAGIRVGLYTSPHLVSITERIKVNGREIDQSTFAAHATRVRVAAESLLRDEKLAGLPTFFEQVTAIAFLAFAESSVDLAILETGLGGRLDSTSVAGAQTVGITQIDLDHQEYLGDSISSIAQEKAAIIRPGAAVVIADHQPAEALEVLRRQCDSAGVTAEIGPRGLRMEGATSDGRFCIQLETKRHEYDTLRLGLRGQHQIDNAVVAIQLAEALGERGFLIPYSAIREGVEGAFHPGRLEMIPGEPSVLLDGAHNPAGARALREYLERFGAKPLTIVFGAMRDKQLAEIGSTIFPVADRVVLTPVNNSRSADVTLLDQIARRYLSPDRIERVLHSAHAVEKAQTITPPEGLICVTGSLYLIGEIRRLIATA